MEKEFLEKTKMIIDLTLAKVEILKLKSDHYNWTCNIPEETQNSLEKTLLDIDSILKNLSSGEQG